MPGKERIVQGAQIKICFILSRKVSETQETLREWKVSSSEKIQRNITPAMLQYLQVKEQYPDCILFFRMGDFYEMFFEDAITAAPILGIALTTRNKNKEDAIPLCGFPYHSVEPYIAKIIESGLKVAICEQIEDPKTTKGVVKRDIVRIITPGTVTDSLTGSENNFLLSLARVNSSFGYALVDTTTGDLFVGRSPGVAELWEQIAVFPWREAIMAESCEGLDIKERFPKSCVTRFSRDASVAPDIGQLQQIFPQAFENKHVFVHEESGSALLILLEYLRDTQRAYVPHLRQACWHEPRSFLVIDDTAKINLEIFQTIAGEKQGSLLGVLDRTVTPMGNRKIRMWLTNPLKDPLRIRARHGAVGELKKAHKMREGMRGILKNMGDIERLMGRVTMKIANARDMLNIKNTLAYLPEIKKTLDSFSDDPLLHDIQQRIQTFEEVIHLLERAIADNPPLTIREGNIIKRGYDDICDEIVSVSRDGKKWIAALGEKERRRTGINSLKIGFNSVFGYYIEISKSHTTPVPAEYIRKQTLVNAERYINEELKKYEETVLGAEEKIREREYLLFCELRDRIAVYAEAVRGSAEAVAEADCLSALADVAERNGYICPQISDDSVIDIKDGRHPAVEKNNLGEPFVPNNTFFDEERNRILLITGPNMAGKSTYIRQVALLVILAQMGSFIPASSARIGVVDRVFTRIGAADNLSRGQSTFMVEMVEVANILQNATQRSLIILDEVGRGTSTFDGMSIAWATAEYIHNQLGSRTLFATHYHQLIGLAALLPGVQNYNIAVREYGERIIFLRKIMEGGTNRSYGIQVAKLAGIPQAVIDRAKEILQEMEESDLSVRKNLSNDLLPQQMNLFGTNKTASIIEEIKSLALDSITPIEAINIINRWRNSLDGE